MEILHIDQGLFRLVLAAETTHYMYRQHQLPASIFLVARSKPATVLVTCYFYPPCNSLRVKNTTTMAHLSRR